MATAGPSRRGDTWQPTRYLEPNKPDNEEVLEQAAYQAAVTKHGGDNRARRYKPRRTVDYMGPMTKWRIDAKLKAVDYMAAVHPNPSDLIGLLPPRALRNPSTSICDYFVHTSINKERSPTRVVKWTPDARRLLTGNDKGQFTLWNGQSFNYESITQVHEDSIRQLAYSHNGQSLVSADKSGAIKYFTPHLTNVHGFQGHREACHGVAWSPNDEKFVTGGDDGLVKIWNFRAAEEERQLSGHGWDVRCVDWHPTKGLIVSGSKDMLVKFWDPRSGKELSTLHSHKATINACKWSPDGHLVATAGGNGQVQLFDIRTFRELDTMKGHTNEVNCIEWHPIHPSLFVTGDSAGTINYYSLTNPDPSEPATQLLEAHEDAVFSLAFHPLGHLLCSGSKDFTSRFWARARPVGGHEIDRWHLGEQKSIEAKIEGRDGVTMRTWGSGNANTDKGDEAKKEDNAVPGLPGLSSLAALGNLKIPSAGQGTANGGPTSLPGFGASHGGAAGGSGSGWQRSQPLPSQDAVIGSGSNSGPSRSSGSSYNDRGPRHDDSGPPRGAWNAASSNGNGGDRGPRPGPYDRPPPQTSGSSQYPPPQNNYGNGPSQYGGSAPPQQNPPYGNTSMPPPSNIPPFAGSRPPFPPNQGYPPPGGNGYPPPQQQGGFRPPPPGFPGYQQPSQGYGQGQGQGYGR